VERWFGIITQRANPPGKLLQRQRTDRQDRAIRGGLQQDQGPVQLDRNGGFNPGEAPATLLANLRDATLDASLAA
jgi:hypothetical protein